MTTATASKKLSTLMDAMGVDLEVPSIEAVQLCADSRDVVEGALFVGLSGENFQARDHLVSARKAGAIGALIESDTTRLAANDEGWLEVEIQGLRERLGLLAHTFYDAPSERLSVVGVTGTNGKTSVTQFAAQTFSAMGVPAGMVGTLGIKMEGASGGLLEYSGRTTPDVIGMHRALDLLQREGAEIVFVEVSSHGLVQGRLDCVQFDAAVFTNLTHDHLDYHLTMEAYASAKRKLFEWPSLKFSVINVDSEWASFMTSGLPSSCQNIQVSKHSDAADIHVLECDMANMLQASVSVKDQQIQINSKLVGEFNLDNLLAVVGLVEGFSLSGNAEELASVLSEVGAPEGRMEVVSGEGQPLVVVDYAHTPDALRLVLASLSHRSGGKLFVCFGCGGDRDVSKRPEMAAIAESGSHRVFVTDDNPRSEDPDKIFKDIETGFIELANVDFEHDRKLSIERAVAALSIEDRLLIAGKGHEAYQEIRGARHAFDDREVAKAALENWSSMMGAIE